MDLSNLGLVELWFKLHIKLKASSLFSSTGVLLGHHHNNANSAVGADIVDIADGADGADGANGADFADYSRELHVIWAYQHGLRHGSVKLKKIV